MKKRHNKKLKIYPHYMYPRKDYHAIPRGKHMEQMMILRFMYKDKAVQEMPQERSFDLSLMQEYMKDSQFKSGISCNLLSVFKKRDAIYWVKNQALTGQDWNFKSKTKHIKRSDYDVYTNPGFFGFRVKDVENISTTTAIYDPKKGCKLRDDEVVCRIEHCPSIVNFWHFNIYLYGIETKSDEKRVYRLDDEVNEKRVRKIAKTLMSDFHNILLTHSKMKEYRLPYQFYRKGKKWNRIKKEYNN